MKRTDELFALLEQQLQQSKYGASGQQFLTVRQFCRQFSCSEHIALQVFHRLENSFLLRPVGNGYCITTGFCAPVSPYGKHLAKKRTNTFGVLLSDICNPFYSALTAHLRGIACENDMELVICDSGGTAEQAKSSMELFLRLGCTGVFNCTSISQQQFNYFSRYPLPIVTMAEDSLRPPNADVIQVDNYSAGRKVACHLIEAGCKSFYYITMQDYALYDMRLRGFADYLLEQGIAFENRHVGLLQHMNGVFRESDIKGLINTALKEADPSLAVPIGIFCVHDLLAVEVIRLLQMRRQGRVLLPDVRVVGFDDLPISSMISPTVTTISYTYAHIALAAWNTMQAYLHDAQHVPGVKNVDFSLVVRESSTGPVTVKHET